MKFIKRFTWTPSSYKHFKSYISYFDHNNPIFHQLSTYPPIVSIQKINLAKQHIQNCQQGKQTLLHIGDCAQPFQHSSSDIIACTSLLYEEKINFMKQCSHALTKIKNKPTHIIGRIAGQYAKPRSSQFVQINGVKIHNYKGDNINSINENDRNPSYQKLIQGYHHSFATAHQIQQTFPQLFISHEGLILPYEQSLTKTQNTNYYCQSAHMLWIGQRTRQLDGAHIQFFRGLSNPIGIKISSNITNDQFIKLITTLNSNNEKGKLIIIIRMGKQKIKNKLHHLIQIKQQYKYNLLFVIDPMHGNTFESKINSFKTRNINDIFQQIKYFEQQMLINNQYYGYSLQSTYQNVTQCFGLEYPIKQNQIIKQKYKSKCDPRLNQLQTFKLISMFASS